jgi:hypothetical protein
MPPRLSPCHTTPGPHTEQRRAIPNFVQVPVASPGRSGLASCHTPPHHHMPSLRAHDTEHNPPAKRSFPLYYNYEGSPGVARLRPPFPPLTPPLPRTVIKMENSTAATRSSWGTRRCQRTKKRRGPTCRGGITAVPMLMVLWSPVRVHNARTGLRLAAKREGDTHHALLRRKSDGGSVSRRWWHSRNIVRSRRRPAAAARHSAP